MPPVPAAPIPADKIAGEMAARERESLGDPSRRSTRDVTGYHIAARDGDIGHVEDFLIDDRAWAMRYLVDPRNWWPGKKVVLSPEWIKTVSWPDSQVRVDLRRAVHERTGGKSDREESTVSRPAGRERCAVTVPSAAWAAG